MQPPAIDKKAIEKQIVELILIMNAAITNLRLYPPSSPMVVNSIGRLFKSMAQILEEHDFIEYAESEKKLLVQGEPVSEKDMARIQINSFLTFMLDLKIHSITFEKGFTKDEITGFLQAIGKTSDEIEAAGGLANLLKDLRIEHIRIDEKIYVGVDSERIFTTAAKIKDEEIVGLITGGPAVSDEARRIIREMVYDPKWISRIFQSCVKQAVQESQHLQGTDLSTKLSEIIDSLILLSGMDKTEISSAVLASVPDMDDTMLLAVMSENIDEIFGAEAFQKFIEQLEDKAFRRLLNKIRNLGKEALKEGRQAHHQAHSMHRIFKMLANSERGKNILGKEKIAEFSKELPEPDEKNQIKKIVSSVAALFEQMDPLLYHGDVTVRTTAAEIIAQFDENLRASDLIEERIALSRKLTQWIQSESVVSSVYEKITANLEGLSRQMIQKGRTDDVGHILETYNLICSKMLSKDEAIQALAANMLQHLATDEILDILLQETRADGTAKRQDDLRSLVILGTTSIERLLDRLHDSHNRQERSRIIQVVMKIGKPAVQSMVERVQQDGPWYYIRNLAMLLGRIGDQSHAGALLPLMKHQDFRVQREVVLALGNLGGKPAGDSLVDNLTSAPDEIKSLIISVLGLMKYDESAPVLIHIIESKAANVSKKVKNDVMIKACDALARINAKDAIPALEKIVQAKGFLAIKAYDPAVRNAAMDALAKLNEPPHQTL